MILMFTVRNDGRRFGSGSARGSPECAGLYPKGFGRSTSSARAHEMKQSVEIRVINCFIIKNQFHLTQVPTIMDPLSPRSTDGCGASSVDPGALPGFPVGGRRKTPSSSGGDRRASGEPRAWGSLPAWNGALVGGGGRGEARAGYARRRGRWAAGPWRWKGGNAKRIFRGERSDPAVSRTEARGPATCGCRDACGVTRARWRILDGPRAERGAARAGTPRWTARDRLGTGRPC